MTYVPLRLISEALDVEVDWVQTLRTARLMTNKGDRGLGWNTAAKQEYLNNIDSAMKKLKAGEEVIVKDRDGYGIGLHSDGRFNLGDFKVKRGYSLPTVAGAEIAPIKLFSGEVMVVLVAKQTRRWVIEGSFIHQTGHLK